MKKIVILFILFASISANAQKMKSRGNTFNPDIGVNALFLSQNSSRDTDDDGFKLQGVEIQFSSDIDSYFTSWILLGVEQEPSGEFVIEPEEAFVETISLPHATVRVGKSKMPIGKHNQLHTHSFPFINAPLVNETILGEEGLSETGVGVLALLPLPWFSEVSLHYTQGESDDLFNSDKNDNKAVIGRYKNLWDLSDALTLEMGFSGAKGKNSDDLDTTLLGGDLTFKWRPTVSGKYRSFEFGSEFLQKDRKGAGDGKLSGLVTHMKYQLAQRWYALYRYDYLGLNESKAIDKSERHTGLIAFVPSEFSAIRLQHETINDAQEKNESRISLQLNISIGAHPAHAY